jgi:hypothetical protein
MQPAASIHEIIAEAEAIPGVGHTLVFFMRLSPAAASDFPSRMKN